MNTKHMRNGVYQEEEEAREEARHAKALAKEEVKTAAATRNYNGATSGDHKSPTQFSSRSYEMWAGVNGSDDQLKDIKSECGESTGSHGKLNNGLHRTRKSSSSLPGSPFHTNRPHHHHGGRCYEESKPLILSTYLDAQEHLPYADDSTVATPLWSEENGAIIVPVYHGMSHHSHTALGIISQA